MSAIEFKSILENNGNLILSSYFHSYKFNVPSSKLETKRRKRKSVKIKNNANNKLLPFEIVSMTGTSCWKVWDKYKGGTPLILRSVGDYEPGWRIRAVELMDNCL